MNMMNRIVSVMLVAACATLASAQIAPDGSLWTDVFNPGGEEVVPSIFYDSSTGIVRLDTRGLNGAVETTDPNMIDGDDVGFIALSFPAPAAASISFIDGFIGGVVWTNQFFNDKQQIFGVGAGAQYLEPGLHDLYQFDAGLPSGSFGGPGDVEMAINFAAGQPGATLFGCLIHNLSGYSCVPEPTSLTIFVTALLGLLGFVRRR